MRLDCVSCPSFSPPGQPILTPKIKSPHRDFTLLGDLFHSFCFSLGFPSQKTWMLFRSSRDLQQSQGPRRNRIEHYRLRAPPICRCVFRSFFPLLSFFSTPGLAPCQLAAGHATRSTLCLFPLLGVLSQVSFLIVRRQRSTSPTRGTGCYSQNVRASSVPPDGQIEYLTRVSPFFSIWFSLPSSLSSWRIGLFPESSLSQRFDPPLSFLSISSRRPPLFPRSLAPSRQGS